MALTGKIGVSTACGIYDVRPEVCRTCMPGDPECQMARRRFGLGELIVGSTHGPAEQVARRDVNDTHPLAGGA